MFFGRRGSITVFICIVLAVLIPLCCILADLARFSMAKKQAETALKTCAESMLAAYDRQLRDQYGLFAVYPRDAEAMEQEIYELLSQNLNSAASAEGVSDLYGFKVRKVEVIPFYNLSEPFVLKQQAAEFMKYRAPVQVVQEFYEKIKVMLSLKKEADMVEKKMDLDRLMNDIRSSLVNLYYMLEEKLPEFNTESGNESSRTLKDAKLELIKSNVQRASKESQKAKNEENIIADAQKGYIEKYPQYAAAQNDFSSAQSNYDSVKSSFENINSRLETKKSELKKAKSDSDIERLNSEIINMEGDLADLRESLSNAENSLSEAQEELSSAESELLVYKSTLDTSIDSASASLTAALEANNSSTYQLNILLSHAAKHVRFHTDLLVIIDELAPKINELDKQSSRLQGEAQNEDGSVSDRISGDLQKQLKSIKKETFTNIKTRLTSNLQKLEVWKQGIEQYLVVTNQAGRDMELSLSSVLAIKAEPQNSNCHYQSYNGYEAVNAGFTALESGLSDMKSLSKLNGIYEIPNYDLVPDPNSEERKAFERWYYKNYYNLDSASQPPADSGELEQIKSGIANSAKVIGQSGVEQSNNADASPETGGTEQDNISLDSFSERKAELPSVTGASSSDEKLRQIGKAIEETISDQVIDESPLDQPVQGIETINENEKTFFNYELQRISELLDNIKKLIANGIESVVEDLYMNEYIVSAFKCATTGEKIEHDIGWGRPIDQSFFKNAEVEYIIFGKPSEKANLGAAKRSVFAIRLMFNLLHVYTDPDKLAATLSTATTIAGWTIFGIPVVQNFLLISWAGLESYVDSEVLLKGQQVPLIKTSSSWYLGAANLADYIKNLFLKDIKEFAQQQVEKQITNASEAIEETVMAIIDSKVDEAFSYVEEGLNNAVSSATDAVQGEIDFFFDSSLMSNLKFEDIGTFSSSFGEMAKGFVSKLSEKYGTIAKDKLVQYKNAFKQRVRDFIFESTAYTAFVDRLNKAGNDLINKGIGAVEGQVDKIFGMSGTSRNSNISARLVMMDYIDYLRLMLLAVPAEKKALRTADLMELNMQEVSNSNDISIDQYNTYLYIKVELDVNTWFLPEKLFKKNNAGMITVEWSQGY